MKHRSGKNNGPKAPWQARLKEERKKVADERDKLYHALTPQQRLEKLDKYNYRALKERAKLKGLIENVKTDKKVPQNKK